MQDDDEFESIARNLEDVTRPARVAEFRRGGPPYSSVRAEARHSIGRGAAIDVRSVQYGHVSMIISTKMWTQPYGTPSYDSLERAVCLEMLAVDINDVVVEMVVSRPANKLSGKLCFGDRQTNHATQECQENR